MKSPSSASRLGALIAGAGLALAAGGCKDIFVAKHTVFVDAISSAGAEKPSGKSYKLVAKRSIVSAAPIRVDVVKACVDAALAGAGMFEAPANVPPEMFIEVGFGQDNTPRVDAAVRETFLDLSARSNPQHSLEHASGPEVWDVRVGVRGVVGHVESAMPLLSAIASTYLASDTHTETKVDVPDNSPIVASVRTRAIAALDAKAPATPAPGGGADAAAATPASSTTASTGPAK